MTNRTEEATKLIRQILDSNPTTNEVRLISELSWFIGWYDGARMSSRPKVDVLEPMPEHMNLDEIPF